MKKVLSLLTVMALLLLLTACGEGKKYEEAAELGKAGRYAEAYAKYMEIKKYKDSRSKAKEMMEAAMEGAELAFTEEKYDEAIALADPFSDQKKMQQLIEYAVSAKNGNYVKGLSISEDGLISFDAHIAEKGARLMIRLEATNDSLSGSASTSVFPEKQEGADASEYFCPEDYFTGEGYCLRDVSMAPWGFSCGSRELTLTDLNVLSKESQENLYYRSLTGFPTAYKAILLDGREGISLARLDKLHFQEIREAFAGGKASVKIVVIEDDVETTLFSLSADIPEYPRTEK